MNAGMAGLADAANSNCLTKHDYGRSASRFQTIKSLSRSTINLIQCPEFEVRNHCGDQRKQTSDSKGKLENEDSSVVLVQKFSGRPRGKSEENF
jgi:hypothetical protein